MTVVDLPQLPVTATKVVFLSQRHTRPPATKEPDRQP